MGQSSHRATESKSYEADGDTRGRPHKTVAALCGRPQVGSGRPGGRRREMSPCRASCTEEGDQSSNPAKAHGAVVRRRGWLLRLQHLGTTGWHWDRRDSPDHHCGPVRDARTILEDKLGEGQEPSWDPRTTCTVCDLPVHVAHGHRGCAVIEIAPMVFLVDDDASVRKGLTRVSTSTGYAVEASRPPASSWRAHPMLARAAWCWTCGCPT